MDLDKEICPVPETYAALATLRFFSLTAIHSEADVLVEVRNIIQKLPPCIFKS